MLEYRGGNFMRCGIYVRVSTDDQRDNGYYQRRIRKIERRLFVIIKIEMQL